MKALITVCFFILFTQMTNGQKFVARNCHIWFIASTPLENIEPHTNQGVSILDRTTGSLIFSVLIKSFKFKVALMEQHFNENYLESDKYPKSEFKGSIINNMDIDYSKDGTYKAQISGNLTIHNVTRPISTAGTITIKDGRINGQAEFIVKPADYNITIPAIVENKIAKEVTVNVEANYVKN